MIELMKRTPVYRFMAARRMNRQLREWTHHDGKIRDLYSAFAGPGDLVFDIGANIGLRTKVLLQLGARVIAVEPQVECASVIERVFGETRSVQVVCRAVGAHAGETELLLSSSHTLATLSAEWAGTMAASGRFPGTSWQAARRVPLTTLDALISEYGVPTFIKVDVEGSELAVLRGLSKPIPAIAFEFASEFLENAVQCLEHLRHLGATEANFTLSDAECLILGDWVDIDGAVTLLRDMRGRFNGDLFVRTRS